MLFRGDKSFRGKTVLMLTHDFDPIIVMVMHADENINGLDEQINKLIYLRRLYKITNQRYMGYQLLSNVFKKREAPILLPDDREMEEQEIVEGQLQIRQYMEGFDYYQCIIRVKDMSLMKQLYEQTQSNYEKLQLYRIIFTDNH